MVGTAAVTRGCYDSVDVEVVDALTGSPACGSEVIAQEASGSTTRFASCFHAELPAGRWTVTARQPGYQPASSEVIVTKVGGCEPAVQSVALSLRPEGAPPPASLAVRPLRPGEAPLNKASLGAPASMGAGAGLPGEGSAAPTSTPTAPASTPSAIPPSGAAGAAPSATAAFPIGGAASSSGGSSGGGAPGAGAAGSAGAGAGGVGRR